MKNSRLITLTRDYKLFKMEANESSHEMHTRFIIFVNKLVSLGKKITNEKMIGKILESLPRAWEPKVTTIKKANNLKKLDFDGFIGFLIAYEGQISLKWKIMVSRRNI